jgi:hypothetical protein
MMDEVRAFLGLELINAHATMGTQQLPCFITDTAKQPLLVHIPRTTL